MELNKEFTGRELRQKIVEFDNSPEFRKLQGFYGQKSSFEVLGIHRWETCHSSFLSWLLNPNEFHGLGMIPIQKLMEVCALVLSQTKQKLPKHLYPAFFDEVLVKQWSFSDVLVETEKKVPDGRIDIYVEVIIRDRKLRIIIENKIKSTENDSQTNKYYNWLKATMKSDDLALLLYLTPLATPDFIKLESPECECSEFLQINYQFLLDYFIEPAKERTTSERARALITDYIRTLSSCAISDELDNNDKNKGEMIMAIPADERELLKNFWEQHQNLILAAFYALSSQPGQDEETIEKAEEVLQFFSKKRDNTLYAVFYDGKPCTTYFKKTNVGREVCQILLQKGITQAEFNLLKKDKSSTIELLKKENEMSTGEKQYDRYSLKKGFLEFQGEKYYVSGNWGRDKEIPRFQDFLKETFPRIELRRQEFEASSGDEE